MGCVCNTVVEGNLRERHRSRWEEGILMKWDVGAWIGSSWLRIGTGGGIL